MRIADFDKLDFKLASSGPLIFPPRLTPLVADPSFLTPPQTPDHKWHLFAHTVFGIYRYESTDGMIWQRKKMIMRSALRPFVYNENGCYYLFYEKYKRLKLLFSFIPGQRWNSCIEMISSKDLLHWSKPQTILLPSLDFHQDKDLGKAVSNPCLIKMENTHRLYFSSSLVRIPDCGFNEPLHISFAESECIDTGYRPYDHPVVSPSNDVHWNNLGAGSMKVIPCEDGYVAFQNGIYEHDGKSGSAICLLYSADGIAWKYLKKEPILKPDPEIKWMASHIYACDVKIFQNKGYLFFNARDHAHWSRGSEKIGLAVADIV